VRTCRGSATAAAASRRVSHVRSHRGQHGRQFALLRRPVRSHRRCWRKVAADSTTLALGVASTVSSVVDTKQTKTIGEHHVAAELARRGWAPALTRDGLERTDILAVLTEGEQRRMVEIQVKAARAAAMDSISWPLGTRAQGPSLHQRAPAADSTPVALSERYPRGRPSLARGDADLRMLVFWRLRRQTGAMPSVQIKDVPEQTHAVLRRRAAAAGQSLQEYLRSRLIQEASEPTLDEVLDRAGGRSGGRVPVADAVAMVRADRDRR
jgi:hypothetical protein